MVTLVVVPVFYALLSRHGERNKDKKTRAQFISTVVTLVVVPVFYALLSRHGERNKDKKTRAQFIFMQLSPNPEGDDPELRRSRELNQ